MTNEINELAKPLFLSDGCTMYHVEPETIVYLQSDSKTCNLFVKDKRAPIVLSGGFANWQEKLSACLAPIKRGVAVNPNYIHKIVRGEVFFFHNGKEISFYPSNNNLMLLTSRIRIV